MLINKLALCSQTAIVYKCISFLGNMNLNLDNLLPNDNITPAFYNNQSLKKLTIVVYRYIWNSVINVTINISAKYMKNLISDFKNI